MPLSLSEDTAQLVGVVSVDEAEPLAQWLREATAPKVGLHRCTTLHTAALQALLAARPVVVSPPVDPFLVTWVLPLLEAEAEGAEVEAAEAEDSVEVPEATPADVEGISEDPSDELDGGDVDGVELDESLVIPPGLAALGEPDELVEEPLSA